MYKHLLLFMWLIVFSPVLAHAETLYYPTGTVVTMQQDEYCMNEQGAQKVLEVTEERDNLSQQIDLLTKQVETQQQVITNLQSEVTAYKEAYIEMKGLVDSQMQLTKDTVANCKTMIDHSKPSILGDIGKIATGVVVGVLIALFASL